MRRADEDLAVDDDRRRLNVRDRVGGEEGSASHSVQRPESRVVGAEVEDAVCERWRAVQRRADDRGPGGLYGAIAWHERVDTAVAGGDEDVPVADLVRVLDRRCRRDRAARLERPGLGEVVGEE